MYRGSLNPCMELNFSSRNAVLTYIFDSFHHNSNSAGCYCYYSGCCHQNNHLNDDFVAGAVAVADVVPEEEVVIAVDNNDFDIMFCCPC